MVFKMNISIVGLNGKNISLKVNVSDTILSAKKKVNQEKAIWKYEINILEDDKTFGDYYIENGDTIISNFKP